MDRKKFLSSAKTGASQRVNGGGHLLQEEYHARSSKTSDRYKKQIHLF